MAVSPPDRGPMPQPSAAPVPGSPVSRDDERPASGIEEPPAPDTEEPPAPDIEETPAASVDRSPVGSVDKALVLLDILGEAGPEGMMLRELTAASGLNKGSIHRLLRALAHRGYAEQDPADQRYRLGPAPLALARSFRGAENLPVLFAPVLAAISLRSRELVHLGRLEGTEVVYLDKVDPQRTLRVWSRVGSRAPAARTSLGRALLAADGVTGSGLAPYAASVGPALPLPRLQEIVEQTRRRGWSEEIEENEVGIACVGVALTREEGHSVAVSITGPLERMGTRRRAELAQLLREELSGLSPAEFTLSVPSQ